MRRLAVALVVVLLFGAPACAEEEDAVTTPTTTLPDRLPPHERDDIAAVFDARVRPLGYTVSRASLITRATYEVDPDGDHLAVYLAPIDDISYDRYAADLPAILEVFVPYVFERWPGLESFDVCQEPHGSTDETPPSQTLVDVTRRAASEVDWAGMDLASLIAAGQEVEGLAVWARTDVRSSATWSDAAGG